MYKLRTHHKHPQGRIFAWMSLVIGFGIGLSLPIFPSFVKSIVHTDSAVSVFYSAMALLMLLAALASTILFKKIHRTTITKLSLIISASVFFLLIFVTHLTELAILNTIRIWFTLLLIMALALFVRDFAEAKDLGEEEGMYYKFHNIGALLGPLLGGFLAASFGYEIVFILTAAILTGGVMYFYHKHIIEKHPAIINRKITTTTGLVKNIKIYFKNTERIKAYFITFTNMAWLGFKRLYIPLYVVMAGYVESMTGIILALSIVPFILLEVRIGEYADKKGVRLPISTGFLIIAVSLFFIFFSPYTLLNFAVFILGNIGAAFVEPLQEYYLFKNLPEKEEDSLYGVYMTADPLAFFLMPAIGALVLVFLPFKFLFLVFGILILLASIFSWEKLKVKRLNS